MGLWTLQFATPTSGPHHPLHCRRLSLNPTPPPAANKEIKMHSLCRVGGGNEQTIFYTMLKFWTSSSLQWGTSKEYSIGKWHDQIGISKLSLWHHQKIHVENALKMCMSRSKEAGENFQYSRWELIRSDLGQRQWDREKEARTKGIKELKRQHLATKLGGKKRARMTLRCGATVT